MFVPPVIIFSRKNAKYLLTSGAPPGTIFKYQPSGWISYETFIYWFVTKSSAADHSVAHCGWTYWPYKIL
jgi:hypothetical protein